MKKRFKTPQLQAMYEVCIRLAGDNFSEFYYGDGRTEFGPRNRRTGAGHRVAFWMGFAGTPNIRFDSSSLAGAAYRAGVDFAKGDRA